MSARDKFTTTVDGAAAYERWHSEPDYDDTPSVSELGGERWSPGPRPGEPVTVAPMREGDPF